MNISKALKNKRDRELRGSVTDTGVTLNTIVDDTGNEIEIMEDDSHIPIDTVTSLNTLIGDINIIPGNNITIDIIKPNTIRISATGGGGVDPEPTPTPGGYDIGWKLIDFKETFELFNIGGIINNEGV